MSKAKALESVKTSGQEDSEASAVAKAESLGGFSCRFLQWVLRLYNPAQQLSEMKGWQRFALQLASKKFVLCIDDYELR